jgi:hypothetical protein
MFDLGKAVEKTKKVYEHDKRAAVDADVIASHLGYSAAKGFGGRAVSALKQYGLLEEVSGKYRISELGYVLIHYDRNSQEWIDAATEAARHPGLFKELLEENPNGLPSDAGLRSDLLKRNFNPDAIAEVVSTVRNTMSFAAGEETVYNENTEEKMPEVQPAEEPQVFKSKTHHGEPRLPQGAVGVPPVRAGEISTPVGKDGDRVVFAVVRFDAGIRKEFVASLKKYLDYLETTLQ